jgi:hypothetical protein
MTIRYLAYVNFFWHGNPERGVSRWFKTLAEAEAWKATIPGKVIIEQRLTESDAAPRFLDACFNDRHDLP